MTLDSWLLRGSPEASLELCPPAKRQRQERPAPATRDFVLAGPRPTTRSEQPPPPKFNREMANNMLKSHWPLEYLYGRRDLLNWYSSRGFYDPAYPYSLNCLPDSPHAIIGLETGGIHVVQCGSSELGLYDPAVGRATSVIEPQEEYRSPVRDLAALGYGRIVFTTDSGLSTLDLEHKESSKLVDSLDVSKLSVHSDRQTIAFGTSSGSVGLADLRERSSKAVRGWANAHAVLTGPRAQRVRHGITAVAWCEDTLIATASNANESVKFWDIRATSRKHPVHSTVPKSAPRARSNTEGGIISLTGSQADPDNALWGLCRNGELLKLSSQSCLPQYRLSVPKLRLNSRYASIDMIPHHKTAHTATGHCAPQHPFIACGGHDGVTLITEPSCTSQMLNLDACQAAQLPNGEPTDVTQVKWHPYTNELITISEDKACRLWAIRPQCSIPSQFLPSDESDAAHRPRKVAVSMTSIAY